MNKEKKVFAQGVCFDKMVILFMLGSFIGAMHESIWGVIKRLYWYGKFVWTNHAGVIYGPFNPLYGFGIVLIILVLARKKRKPWQTFMYGAVLGGVFEYITSFLLELFLGARSWDYSDYFLNINGRTTIPYMIFWGIGIMILVHLVFPFVSKGIEAIPYKLGKFIVWFCVVFMSINMVVSWTALVRQVLRHKGVAPYTFVGEFYDKVYTDEFLKKIYRNMKFVK